MKDVDKILNWLDEVSIELKKHNEELQRSALKTAPKFNPFRFFKNDEVGLSYLIAFLLNPNETHGQGRLFLDNFLRTNDMQECLVYDKVEVYTEHLLKGSARRHDIFIQGWYKNKTHWAISIENKLRRAVDQRNQVLDYLKDLEGYVSEQGNYHLCYLTVDGYEPSETSIKEFEWESYVKKNKAQLLSATDIFNWLENCFAYAGNVELFIEQFKDYIKENIMGMADDETSKLIEGLCSTEERLFSAWQIIKSRRELENRLLDMLSEQLEELGRNNEELASWEFWSSHKGKDWRETNKKLFFIPPSSTFEDDIMIGIACDQSDFREWFFGIQFQGKPEKTITKYEDENAPPIELSKKFREKNPSLLEFFPNDKYSRWWAFYSNFEPPYHCNWEVNETGWINILNGELAKHVIENVLIVKKHLEDKGISKS